VKTFLKAPLMAATKTAAVATMFCIALGMAAGGAGAQDIEKAMQGRIAAGVAKMEGACGKELRKYCSQVTPGEGRIIFCMEAYEDKLSPKCLATMYDAAQNAQALASIMKTATAMCRDDAVKTCGKVRVGHGRVLQCLLDNKSTVSKSCADAVQKVSDFAAAK